MSALANNSAQQYKNMILTRRDSLSNRESYAFPRPVEFHEHEDDYQLGWSWNRTKQWYLSIPEDTVWNVQLCFFALLAIIMVPIHDQYQNAIPLLDFFYNLDFAFMVFAISYSTYANREYTKVNLPMKLSFLIDIISYMHYVVKVNSQGQLKLICYYMRLHRPYRYLFALNDFNLTGSVVATTLKYCYLTLVLRVTWALVWTHMDEIEKQYIIMHGNDTEQRRAIKDVEKNYYSTLVGPESGSHWQGQNYSLDMEATRFLIALYVINKMFIPIGPSVELSNDVERIACLCVMLTGCLIVTGAAAASLSLVIGIYMRPEEAFRSRYRLIIKEMKDSHIQPSLREKVETFYKMYWQKQRAVSATKLLPTFPPTLPNSIYTDIYFEATQKSRILRDLSYPFLSEIAKKMATIHYIPGDTIIKRSSTRSSNIYITYGDIEMLTAEDDSSPILRMSRGTVLSPCGGCAPVACGRAHVQFRAGTFCTGHVLTAADLWRTVLRHGKSNGDAEMILASFYKHIERVKRHYNTRVPEGAKYKSSILHFKRNLMALKEAKDANGNLLLNRTDVFLEIAGAYIMRNVILIFLRLIQRADASLTDESDAICLRSTFPCILQPSSSLLDCWNYFVASFIFAVCLVHPYYLVYKKNVTLEFKFFDFMATVIYVLDLMVYLSTGANVEEGVPITFAQTSSQQMRSHWFVLDVVATAPIFEFVGNGQFAGINKILRLPKVFRVLKSLEETCVYHSNIIRFLSYTLILLIACYLIAALQQHFMCYQLGNCLVYNFTHAPHWENKPLDEETVQNRLLFGLFWAMSMLTFTTHMETGTTASWGVVYYTMFVLEICIVLHCFVEAVYSATIMVTTALREDYDSCIGDVKTFFLRTNMDPIIQQRFLTYLDLCWHTDKAYTITNKRNSIFYDLPPHVYQDILTKQRSKYVLCIPFMKYLHKEVLKDLSSKARMFYTSPNEILVNAGDIINEIYVVIQGFCEISCPDIDGRVVNTLGAKNSLGVIECLLRIPSLCTIKACTHVQILSISRKHLLSCVSKSPQIMECIKYAKELPEFHRLKQRRQSTVCYEPPVPPPNVEKFLLPKKHQPDYEFIQPFMKLGFLAILRYVFPRFTIRPDGSYLVRYEWFRAVCALLSALIYPGYAYLSLQWPVLILITLLLDVSAYYDIFQRMLVGYFNERGILMYHPSNTAAHYLKGTFIVDLFACLPLELLETARIEDIGNKYCITPTKQLLMLNRILQLYRLPNAMTLTKYIDRRDVVLLVKALPIFMVLLSVLTCVLVFNSVNIYVSADHEWLIIPFDDRGGSWINLFDDAFRFNVTETPWNLHLAVYFWIVYSTTNTGYNNLRPTNFKIMNVLFCGLVIGAMMTTYFSVRIISIRANVNTALATYQEHLKDIMVFMEREKLDKKLQKAVLDYYEYNWQKMSGIDYRNVLKLCDQISLRTDVTLNLYGSIFKKCPILLDCDVSILRMIGRAVHSLYFLQDTVIVDKSDVISDVYFLDYGNLEVREVISQDQSTVAKLTMGSLFGNLYGNPTDRCPVSLVATNKVHLLQINAQVFQNIVSDFPSVQERIRHSCSNNEKYIRGEKNECHVKPERRLSSPILARSREGLAKYLNNRSLMMQFYFIVVSIMCVYADVYNAGFQDNSPAFIVVLYVLDFGFYLKVLLNYALPHLVVEENLKIMKIAERKLYFRGEFKFDIVSCLPVEMLSFTRDGINWMLFSWLRLNRMLRIVTVSKNLNRHQTDLTYDLMMTTVVSVTIWFTLFIHCITCLWYFIGINEDEKAPRQSWLYKDDGTDRCSNVYVCSLYFILTTFMQNGIGDIMPKLHTEVMFVSLFQVISTMVYMVYVGEFSNLIHFKSFRLFSYYYKYLELQDFLQNNRVSKNLVSYVNKYCLHFWREKRGEQVPHFLKAAPHCLKQRVMSAAFMYHLTNHPIFRHCEPELLRHLVVCFELYTYTEDMFVVKEYEITDSMYFIHTGRVEETSEDPEERAMIYTAGQSFGELQGLFRDTPYKHSYRTTIKSQVLTLHLTNWEYLLIHFPKSSNAINTNFENPEEGTHSQRLKHRRATLKEDNFSANLPSNKPQVINAGSSYTSPIDQEKSVTEDVEDSTLPIKEFTSATSSDQQDCRTEMTPLFLGRSHSSVSFKNVKAGERDKQSGVAMKTEITGESKRNASDTRKVSSLFMDIISKTAKKLSRRYSSTTQLSSGVSAKDILLFQEDEATTTAIIEKLEEAQRERKAKIAMKKSISINDDEEIKEEYMETVDMTLGTSHDSKGSEEIIPMTQMSGRSVEEYLSKEHKRNKALARYKANKYLISKGVRQKLKNRLARVHYTEDRDEASTSHGKKHDVTFPNESDEEKTLAVEVMVENSAQSATKVEDALDAVSIKPEVKGSSSQAYSSQGIKSVNSNDNELLPGSDEAMNDSIQTQSSNSLVRIRLSKSIHKK